MRIFAHRGAARTRREENTLGAFAAALAAGAALESDARLSSDGQVVLVHDAFVRRGPRLARVRSTTAARLRRRFDAPSIDDLYRELGADFDLSIDLKIAAAGVEMVRAAERAGAVERLWLVSDRVDLLSELRIANTDVRLVHEARRAEVGDRIVHAGRLAAAAVDAQNADVGEWTAEAVTASRSAGVLAFGSLANDTGRFDRARMLGIDAIYTDHLDLARPDLAGGRP